ncbi:MAG: hypothetical protein EPO02_00040 [Nitrospirae bacterium]|nr:MAG: hypothetical protein EPO02_00040 [Nitrospirota bacterium]
MTRTGVVCVQVLGLFACVALALADEALPIGTLLQYPESYNAHTVTLQGVARQVQPLGPYVVMDCGNVYDSYKFVLEDATGSLDVTVPGPCEKPKGTMVPVADGDNVAVQVMISVLPSDRLPPPVKGTATAIQRLGK